MSHGNGIDEECLSLCNALNDLKGITTISSCCGHNENPFRIWFFAKGLGILPHVAYWFARCHCGFEGWKISITTDCAKSPIAFLIEGPVGAFDEANKIAELIQQDDEIPRKKK